MVGSRGGVNSIPLTCPNDDFDVLVSEVKLEKRVLFDWISFTFDDLDEDVFTGMIRKPTTKGDKNHYNMNNGIMNALLKQLGCLEKDWKNLEIRPFAMNGFRYSIVIGESIMINLGGPKSARNRSTTQLLMKGEGCREFIEFQNGNWFELFKFLKNRNGHFKRVDIAIDDFTANEIDIYDLEQYAKKGYWSGSFQSLKVISDISYRGGLFSKGFSMTFGSEGSSQLQIYDKNLERRARNKETFATNKWYRYEMRLVEDKADAAISQYMTAIDASKTDDSSIGKYACGILRSLIEFKEIPMGNDERIRRWKILPQWYNFLDGVEKITLNVSSEVEKTIDRKIRWYNKSITSTNAQFYLSNPDIYFDEHFLEIGKACFNLNNRQIAAINKKRKSKGIKEITNIEIKDIALSLLNNSLYSNK